MLNTSIISILRSFSKGEVKEFDKFIISPFFNNQPSLTNFYNELKRFHPGFNSKGLERKQVFERLYPGKQFSDDTIRRLSSDLKRVIDSYIYYKAQEANPIETRFPKALEYIRRGLVKEGEKELEQIGKAINNTQLISNEYIKNRLEFEDLTVQISLSRNQQQMAAGNFLNEIEYLIYFFIFRLAYYIHNINANKIIFNLKENDLIFDFIRSVDFETIENLIKTEKKHEINKAIRIHVLVILNYLREKEEKYFIEFKSLLPEVINEFTDHEKYNIFQVAEALCWKKMESINREKYRRELFEVNNMRLEAKVFSPDGKQMRVLLFKQILNTSLQLKETGWAREFVKEYAERLPQDVQENMKSFAFANLLFEEEDFEGSLNHLRKIDIDHFALKYDVRNLQLRIFIEMEHIEEALSLIDAYKHFIANNKSVSEYYRQITNNFLRFCKNIIDLKMQKGKLSADEIKRDIENENAVNFKSWLLEKINAG